jgi:hypothetical protein
MEEPNPDDYFAQFVDARHRGKATRNLYIYEKSTNAKRYSVTMPEYGAKIQPYFDIPRIGAGAYGFTSPNDNLEPIWLKPETVTAIRTAANEQDLNVTILAALQTLGRSGLMSE